jgi:hypothetical protein
LAVAKEVSLFDIQTAAPPVRGLLSIADGPPRNIRRQKPPLTLLSMSLSGAPPKKPRSSLLNQNTKFRLGELVYHKGLCEAAFRVK